MRKDNIQGMEGSDETNKMAIAQVIGGTIGLIGLILLLYGLFGGESYSQSDGININLYWGLLMLVFGLIMGLSSFFSGRRKSAH